jgi:hypothetical protein
MMDSKPHNIDNSNSMKFNFNDLFKSNPGDGFGQSSFPLDFLNHGANEHQAFQMNHFANNQNHQ